MQSLFRYLDNNLSLNNQEVFKDTDEGNNVK